MPRIGLWSVEFGSESFHSVEHIIRETVHWVSIPGPPLLSLAVDEYARSPAVLGPQSRIMFRSRRVFIESRSLLYMNDSCSHASMSIPYRGTILLLRHTVLEPLFCTVSTVGLRPPFGGTRWERRLWFRFMVATTLAIRPLLSHITETSETAWSGSEFMEICTINSCRERWPSHDPEQLCE